MLGWLTELDIGRLDGHSESKLSPQGTRQTVPASNSNTSFYVQCGPLLNYQHMGEEDGHTTWNGTVLLVTKPGQYLPELELAPINGDKKVQKQKIQALKLYEDPDKTFWRFSLKVPLGAVETNWQYTIAHMKFEMEVSTSPSRDFYVPSAQESMRIMFHSCNGFLGWHGRGLLVRSSPNVPIHR